MHMHPTVFTFCSFLCKAIEPIESNVTLLLHDLVPHHFYSICCGVYVSWYMFMCVCWYMYTCMCVPVCWSVCMYVCMCVSVCRCSCSQILDEDLSVLFYHFPLIPLRQGPLLNLEHAMVISKPVIPLYMSLTGMGSPSVYVCVAFIG